MSNVVARKHIRRRAIGFGIFVLWFGLVLLMAWHHAFWRDEVRALSAARHGDDVIAMLRNLDEGHPALWYLMLRSAYFIVGKPWVLPVLSIAVASAVVVLVLRSPLGWSLIAPLVFSYLVLFEYSVMARNYGISMLLLLLLAACYRRHYDHGVVLGVLLFLLANTNVHSSLLVAAFLLFWLIELVAKTGVRWTPSLQTFLVNFCLAATGVAICAVTVYPTQSDAAVISRLDGLRLGQLLGAIFYPAGSFSELGISRRWDTSGPTATLKEILDSILIVGTLFSLVRWPAAFLASLSALIAFSLFFTLIYPGYFRHEALWLCFVIALHWITREHPPQLAFRPTPRLEPMVQCLARAGWTSLMSLVGLLTLLGINEFVENVIYRIPLSASQEFADFVRQRPDLHAAIMIADPDYLVEALPYYIDNPTYLMREKRFGNTVKFTSNARLTLTLDDILATAQKLHAEQGRPVLIMMGTRLDLDEPQETKEGLNWWLLTTPDQVHRFLTSTRLIAQFWPKKGDEKYDVYLLNASWITPSQP